MTTPRSRAGRPLGLPGAVAIGLVCLLAGCGTQVTRTAAVAPSTSSGPPAAGVTAPPAPPAPTTPVTPAPPSLAPEAPVVPATTTSVPCSLSATPGTANTVPVDQVCSAIGAPHFATPEAAMTYMASAWNANDVQELDYVTDPAGRAQMDSMATLMVNLHFTSCTQNPAGDDTCYFTHDIAPSTSPTTYPNPMGYPPGEAVFTAAPAAGPGWYLTQVLHCG